jgi:hypothetical protein
MAQLIRLLWKHATVTIGNERDALQACARPPEHSARPSTILNDVGDAWRCWRLRGESDREFAFRLGVHLQTLAIAVEDDLERVLQAERTLTQRSEEDGSINDR